MPAARTRNSHSSLRCRRSKACAHSQSTEAPCMAGRRYVHGASRTFCKLNKRRRRLGAKLGKSRREHREHKKKPYIFRPYRLGTMVAYRSQKQRTPNINSKGLVLKSGMPKSGASGYGCSLNLGSTSPRAELLQRVGPTGHGHSSVSLPSSPRSGHHKSMYACMGR